MCSIQMIETPAAADVADQLDQRAAFVLGQPAGDLVEQQNARLGGERAGELQPLAVEQRQAPAGRLALSRERAVAEHLDAARIDLALAVAAAEGAGDHQVLEHRHAAERLRNLERAADAQPAAPLGRQPRDVVAGEDDAPGIGLHRAAGDAEQRGLAGAVRPDDAERLALVNARSISFATTTAPKRLETFSKARMAATVIGPLPQPSPASGGGSRPRFTTAACSSPPVGISGAVLLVVMTRSNLSPLRCHCPATSGVLVTFFTGCARPLHRPDDGFVIGGHDRIEDRLRLRRLRALEHVDRHLEQRMLEADRLRPRPPGGRHIGVGELLARSGR